MEATKFPKLSTGFGLKVMADNGAVFNRVDNIMGCKPEGNFLVCGNVIDTVASVRDGQVIITPIFVPNNIFTDENGQGYLRAHEDTEAEVSAKADDCGLGYIIARKQPDKTYVAEAWLNGEQVDFPTSLWNELGVEYKHVDYKNYGNVCKRVYGYYIAKKVEPVYVFDAAVGEKVQAVINGVKEHEAFIEKGETKVQNMYHGESYKMKLKKLKKLYYYFETTAEGIQIWKPKDEEQTWTYTKENVFGILWGGFEFLAKAMINLTDQSDVYGCNYDIFNDTDLAKGSHIKLKLFLPTMPLARTVLDNPQICAGQGLTLEAVPKTDYVEVPMPMEIYRKVG